MKPGKCCHRQPQSVCCLVPVFTTTGITTDHVQHDETMCVFCVSGSSASTNSDSDCQSLHAGVCAHQTAIPTKDANIAREALEILVTCLQLRSELIGQFCCIVVVVFLMPTSPGRPWRVWSPACSYAVNSWVSCVALFSLVPTSPRRPWRLVTCLQLGSELLSHLCCVVVFL